MSWKDHIRNNPAILLSEKKVHSLLSDVYLNDRLKINLMMNAYSIGIIDEMREHFPVDQFTIGRWKKIMISNYGVSEEKADWAITTWKDAITASVLLELANAEKDELAYEEQKRIEL